MNIYKRAKAVIEHDRAELKAERACDLMNQAVRDGKVTLFLKDAKLAETAIRWLGWAKRELMRHGARGV